MTPRPFAVMQDLFTGQAEVVGPKDYRYVLRGANSVAHAEAWAQRLNEVYAMGIRAGQKEAVNG